MVRRRFFRNFNTYRNYSTRLTSRKQPERTTLIWSLCFARSGCSPCLANLIGLIDLLYLAARPASQICDLLDLVSHRALQICLVCSICPTWLFALPRKFACCARVGRFARPGWLNRFPQATFWSLRATFLSLRAIFRALPGSIDVPRTTFCALAGSIDVPRASF